MTERARTAGKTQSLFKHVNDNTNATVTAIAAVTGKTTRVYQQNIIVSKACTVTMKSGSTDLGEWDLQANEGIDFNYHPHYIPCGTGEALTYTKSDATAKLSMQIWYSQETD